jgi:hypothetical protein
MPLLGSSDSQDGGTKNFGEKSANSKEKQQLEDKDSTSDNINKQQQSQARGSSTRMVISSANGSRIGGTPGSGDGGASSRTNKTVSELDERSAKFFAAMGIQPSRTSNKRTIALTEEQAGAITKKKKALEKRKSQILESGSTGGSLRTKKFVVADQKRNVATEGDAISKPFGLSDLMKYFLIAVIVILLLIFVGGQALQISKNWEKSE